MSDRPADLFREPLRQPDQRSCGASVLVVARMLLDDAYAGFVAGGRHGGTGFALPGTMAARFRHEVLDMHRRVTGCVDVSGHLQAPWPRALGTPPWAVARQLSGTGSEDHPARRHTAHLVTDRAAAYDRLVAATTGRRPVPLFVGSRWLPRHVVLVLGEAGTGLRCYEPARGRLCDVTRDDFVAARLGLAGWDRPWFIVPA